MLFKYGLNDAVISYSDDVLCLIKANLACFGKRFLTFRTNPKLKYEKQRESVTFISLSFTLPAVLEVSIKLVTRRITSLLI